MSIIHIIERFGCFIFFFIKCKTMMNLIAVKSLCYPYLCIRASLIAQMVKNQSAVQETPVQFLGWDEPLEKG